jgi:hypothetical protein
MAMGGRRRGRLIEIEVVADRQVVHSCAAMCVRAGELPDGGRSAVARVRRDRTAGRPSAARSPPAMLTDPYARFAHRIRQTECMHVANMDAYVAPSTRARDIFRVHRPAWLASWHLQNRVVLGVPRSHSYFCLQLGKETRHLLH